MKILYVSQYYPPEMGAPAARVSELARRWAASGADVTVLTAFPHHPHGEKRPEDRWKLFREERDPVEPAVRVLRSYVYAAPNQGFLRRVASYLSFMFSAIFFGLFRAGRPDVVVATSPQLFAGVAGGALAIAKRARFVFEVRDLWPESIVTVGAMRESLAIRGLKKIAAALYFACDRLVTVGPGYRRRIIADYGVPPEKIDVVTNGVELELFRDDARARAEIRSRRGWEGKTVAMYLGTHGMAHGLDAVLDVARRVREEGGEIGRDLRFVLVGDGAEKRRLVERAAREGLTNVAFLDPVAKDEVVRLYAASDVCLAPLRKTELFTEVLPSKIFEIMAMRRPILLSVDGDAREVVERAGAGLFVEPENVEQMTAALLRLASDPAERRAMGLAGRRHVERFYSRSVLADRYLDLLEELLEAQPIEAQPIEAVNPARIAFPAPLAGSARQAA